MTGTAAPPAAPRSTTNLWRAARIKRRFTIVDLATACERPERLIKATIYLWVGAGYLRREPKVRPHAIYVMIRDTGPLPPRHSKRQLVVIDRNTGETHPVRTGWWAAHQRRKNGRTS